MRFQVYWTFTSLCLSMAIVNPVLFPVQAQIESPLSPDGGLTTESEPVLDDLNQEPDARRGRGARAESEPILEELNQEFGARRGRGARRGDICAVSPGLLENVNVIWSDRPLFLWQGGAAQIIVRDFDTETVLWTQTFETPIEQIIYGETAPLQPGRLYQWQLLNEADDPAKVPWFTFQVMDAAERDRITAELQNLDNQLSTNGATEETIALQKAQVFMEQNLLSDALQVLLAIDQPSPEVTQLLQEMVTSVCSS